MGDLIAEFAPVLGNLMTGAVKSPLHPSLAREGGSGA